MFVTHIHLHDVTNLATRHTVCCAIPKVVVPPVYPIVNKGRVPWFSWAVVRHVRRWRPAIMAVLADNKAELFLAEFPWEMAFISVSFVMSKRRIE